MSEAQLRRAIAVLDSRGLVVAGGASDLGTKREFAWMTAHRYKADREVAYPFTDWRSLKLDSKR